MFTFIFQLDRKKNSYTLIATVYFSFFIIFVMLNSLFLSFVLFFFIIVWPNKIQISRAEVWHRIIDCALRIRIKLFTITLSDLDFIIHYHTAGLASNYLL